MSIPQPWRCGLAAILVAAAAGGGPAWAETREVDPRRVDAAADAVRAARRRIVQHDIERQKRLLILKAERIEALRLNQRARVEALTLQRQLLQQQGRTQALVDREHLQQGLDDLRLALGGTPVE